jgi:hypothetical protein
MTKGAEIRFENSRTGKPDILIVTSPGTIKKDLENLQANDELDIIFQCAVPCTPLEAMAEYVREAEIVINTPIEF